VLLLGNDSFREFLEAHRGAEYVRDQLADHVVEAVHVVVAWFRHEVDALDALAAGVVVQCVAGRSRCIAVHALKVVIERFDLAFVCFVKIGTH
jgi:molybdopterin synthase catalytic subunit